MFIKISLTNDINLIIGCVYFPPTSDIDMYAKHCDILESLALRFTDSYFLITGDFNLNSFDWKVDPIVQNHLAGNIIYNCYVKTS